jgi:hypothetical protein
MLENGILDILDILDIFQGSLSIVEKNIIVNKL